MDDKTRLLRSLAIDRRSEAESHSSGASKRWMVGGAAVFIIMAGAALWIVYGQGQRQDSTPQAEVPQPQTSAAVANSEPKHVRGLIASGYVIARRRATIAAEITGKVVDLLVEEGMIVQQDQVLARLDSALAEKDLALAQSRVEAAKAASAAVGADLRDAERIFDRTKALSQRNIASDAEMTKAEARVAVLQAQLRQSDAQLATAKLDAQRTAVLLEKHQIRAPFSGVVVERSAQPGEVISPLSAGGFTRTGICTIVDMNSIEIEVDVNEAFIGRLDKGVRVNAVLDAYPDWTIPGSVIAIVPTANREKATVKVRIGLTQKDPRILPDMAVKVTFLDDATAAARSSTVDAH
jgi:RND family efflux transporter MFP subunit